MYLLLIFRITENVEEVVEEVFLETSSTDPFLPEDPDYDPLFPRSVVSGYYFSYTEKTKYRRPERISWLKEMGFVPDPESEGMVYESFFFIFTLPPSAHDVSIHLSGPLLRFFSSPEDFQRFLTFDYSNNSWNRDLDTTLIVPAV